MTYLPSDYIKSEYKYTLSDGVIRVITNKNCYQNYNSTYCDCYDIYLNNDYLVSNTINCNNNPTNYITSENFTSDFYYRKDFDSILVIFLILSIFIIYIPYRVLSRIFGRWLRV